MNSKMILFLGIFVITILLIIGCSNDRKNPTEPSNKIKNQETLYKNSNPSTLDPDKPISNPTNSSFEDNMVRIEGSREEVPAQSSSGCEIIGEIHCLNFLGIYDETVLGGFPSMKFRAFSAAYDEFHIVPQFIEEISVTAKAWWHKLDETNWKLCWDSSDKKTDWWKAEIVSSTQYKKYAWTAKSQSYHEFKVYGYDKVGVLKVPIEYTAYFIERKQP